MFANEILLVTLFCFVKNSLGELNQGAKLLLDIVSLEFSEVSGPAKSQWKMVLKVRHF